MEMKIQYHLSIEFTDIILCLVNGVVNLIVGGSNNLKQLFESGWSNDLASSFLKLTILSNRPGQI